MKCNKCNVEFYQKDDDMPLGIRVGNERTCIAPVIALEDKESLTIEEVIK